MSELGKTVKLFPTSENDPELPNLVWARGKDQEKIILSADFETIRRMEDDWLNAKIGEYCGLIHGVVPGGTLGLMGAHALFVGVKRPCITPGRDGEIYAYVIAAGNTYVYRRNAKHTGAGPEKWPRPLDSVFVVYADLTPSTYELASGEKLETGGAVLLWEWIFADSKYQQLPDNYEGRYTRRVW